jgi:hypothetical protein
VDDATTAAAELPSSPLEGPPNSISKNNVDNLDADERMRELQERLIEAQRALQVIRTKLFLQNFPVSLSTNLFPTY